MSPFDPSSGVALAASISDPTVAITAAASVMLLLATAFMVFVALAPHVSPTFAERFATASSDGGRTGAVTADD